MTLVAHFLAIHFFRSPSQRAREEAAHGRARQHGAPMGEGEEVTRRDQWREGFATSIATETKEISISKLGFDIGL